MSAERQSAERESAERESAVSAIELAAGRASRDGARMGDPGGRPAPAGRAAKG